MTANNSAAATNADSTDWPRPGPGSWELDTAHFGSESSRLARDLIESALPAGMAQGFALVGGPIQRMDARFVNGRFYRRLVPVVGANSDRPPPPAAIMWLASRLHPALRRANRRAGDALEHRIWLDELKRWEGEFKPALVARSQELTAVDPADLNNTQLADHLDDLLEHMHTGTVLHFRLHASDLGPIGLLLVQAREWGLGAVEVMAALAGASPATSAPSARLAEVTQLIQAANRLPDDGATTTTSASEQLEALRALSPSIAERLDAFIAEYGWRLTTGYDVRAKTLVEDPEVLVTLLGQGSADVSVADTAEVAGAEALERLRAQLAPSNHEELDRLVADARRLYGLRDENGPLTYQWPAGLLRRAVIEIAQRLERLGALPANSEPGVNEVVFDLSGVEMASLLRGVGGPSVEELTGRRQQRRGWAELDPPRWLGPEPADPPLHVLPSASARLMAVVLAVVELLEHEAEADGAVDDELNGVGIGSEVYAGRACVAADPAEAMSRFQPGDVLVAPLTVPTFNSVLAMAGAVVTDHGGLLCHAAVIARELGIAGVVGVGSGTTSIPDGATVEVDPAAGRVRVL